MKHSSIRALFLSAAALYHGSALVSATTTASSSSMPPFPRRQLNNNQDDDAIDFSWISNYSIRFHSCHTAMEFRPDSASGDGENESSPTELLQLVRFRLCPTRDGGTCRKNCRHGADYVVELREFLESYLELVEDQREYQCEQVANNCYCNDDNDDEACLQQCYTEAGLTGCDNDNNGGDDDEFELDRYLECRALNEDDDYRQSLYVGAYCSNNGIYLGTFTDRQCTQKASKTAYSSYTGYELPYTSTSIISTKECMSCQEPSEYDDDQNADQYDADQVKEVCEDMYDRAAKCERKLQNVDTKSTSGCEYIHKLLPQVERIAKGSIVSPSRVMAWIFFCSTLGLAGYIAHTSKAFERSQVALMDRGGVCA